MYLELIVIWKENCQSPLVPFRWQRLNHCQIQHRIRMWCSNSPLNQIHHKHQRNQSRRPVHQAIQIHSDGICIHRFVRVIQFEKVLLIRFYFIRFKWLIISIFKTAPPSFAESGYRANIVDKNDSEHTRLNDGQAFAPRYPVYTGQTLPTAPNPQWTTT